MGAQACNRTSALGGTGASARGAARTTTEVNALVRSHHASLESHVGWPSSWQTALVGAGFELSWCVAAFSLRMWREVGPECSPERQNAPGTAHKSSERVPACPSEAPSALGLPHLAVTTLRNRAAPLANRAAVMLRNRAAPQSPTGLRPCSARGPRGGPTRPPPAAVPGPWAVGRLALGRRTYVGFHQRPGPRRVTEHGHEVERRSIPPGWVVNMAIGVASRG